MACSFSTEESKPIGKSTTYTKQSKFRLESRFKLYEAEEIAENEFPILEEYINKPYILNTGEHEVELYFKHSDWINDSKRKRSKEILLLPTYLNNDYDDGDRHNDTKLLKDFLGQHPSFNEFYKSFETQFGKETHGRIFAPGFVKSIEYFSEEEKPITLTEVKEVEKTINSSPIIQTLGLTKPIPSGINIESPQKGCFGRKTPTSIGGVPLVGATNRGCFGSNTGAGGCFGFPSLGNNGCLLPALLLFLAALLWAISSLKSCNQNNNTAPIIIHDTIKIEVQKIDTLTIVKTDTLSYIDSTTQTSYETVSLPNVQFITNSDILLPSSASDLQKLAEYLVKNDSLKATIYGHTDNVGDPKENLRLSQRRAESVKRFLSSLGVESSRLDAVGLGDTQPKADNKLDEGRLINRRVEVKLTNTNLIKTKRTQVEKDVKGELNVKNKLP